MTFPSRTRSTYCSVPETPARTKLYTPNQIKNKKRKNCEKNMRESSSTWVRNRNIVRHTPKTLGSVSQGVILGILVLVIGLIYVTQGTKATSYDYELNEVDDKIAELEAEIEDLALERARLTSIAAVETNEVAATMVDATVSGYAE